jgi:hypothetical protein
VAFPELMVLAARLACWQGDLQGVCWCMMQAQQQLLHHDLQLHLY